jgi:hypothetical protein
VSSSQERNREEAYERRCVGLGRHQPCWHRSSSVVGPEFTRRDTAFPQLFFFFFKKKTDLYSASTLVQDTLSNCVEPRSPATVRYLSGGGERRGIKTRSREKRIEGYSDSEPVRVLPGEGQVICMYGSMMTEPDRDQAVLEVKTVPLACLTVFWVFGPGLHLLCPLRG